MNLRLSQSRLIRLVLVLLLGLSGSTMAIAQQPLTTAGGGLLSKLEGSLPAAAKVDQVHIRLIAEQQALVPGQRQWFGLVLDHEPGWHTYWRNPGDSGLATTAKWQLQDSAGASVVEPRLVSQAWPTPSRLAVGPLANYGYENQVVLGFELDIPKALSGVRRVVAEASWLVCKDVCIPGEAKLAIDLPVVATAQQATPGADAPLFAQMRGRLPVETDWGQGFAVDPQANVLMLWGQGEWSSRQGLWFVELEELINPAAGQSWFALPQGWLVKIPLSERPKRALASLQKTGQLHAVLKPNGTSGTGGTAAAAQSLGPSGYRLQFVRQAAPVLGEAKAVWQSPMASEEPHRAAPDSASSSSLWVILGLAFLGGMALNLMPCVFPVLGLKVLAFSQQAHSPGQAWRHAAFFTVGVLFSMLALAGLLLGLRAAGEAVGWGFQLQNPWVVLSLAVLFTGIGLNLLGVFEVGTSLTQLGQFDRGHGPLAAFGSGVLAVVVASPCTAPFMGSAVGYTATAPTAQTLAVFAVLGLGLAAPYGLAAIWPGLLTRLPRPGPWMVTFKQFLAFPMMATVAWLVWVLTQQQGLTVLMPVLLALVLLSFAAWCWGGLQAGGVGTALSRSGRLWRWIGIGLALLASVWLVRPVGVSPGAPGVNGSASQPASPSANSSSTAISWQPWASGKPEALAAQGRLVFVDFTAAWCITCQANKVRVLQTSPVVDQLNGTAVVPLVADWTKQDPAITKELQRYGRNGVPLYLVYGPKLTKPIVLGEWLSTDTVMSALRQAGL